jgi:pyridinium-3,5-biscarboxylic acid mononucleotide sulfurtransferase
VRELARALGVPSAEKPASPCLASRIPYGTAVDPETLEMIDHAEAALKGLGFRILRVRHYGDAARVELGEDELPRALAAIEAVAAAVRAAGYATVEISPEPFRSGSLNMAFSSRLQRRFG